MSTLVFERAKRFHFKGWTGKNVTEEASSYPEITLPRL